MNIIITGAGKGIGLETTRILSAKHKVIAISRDISELYNLNTSSVIPLSMDITKHNSYEELATILLKHFPKVDVLINNAGILINKQFKDFGFADFDEIFNTNIKAPFFLIQKLMDHFSNGAHILNISSMGGFQGSSKFPGLSAYSASKGALSILSECLAEELRPSNINVNCLCLGAVETLMLKQAFPGYSTPIKPQDIAMFIADFAINGHKYFNGRIIPVTLTTP